MPREAYDPVLEAFMGGLRKRESGRYSGRYDARGTVTSSGDRAYGAYQIMGNNWASWAKEAGIAGADIRDPKAQDVVAEFKIKQYYARYGDWKLVAIAWFGGQGAADMAKKYGIESVGQRKDANGTSIADYAEEVMGYMAYMSKTINNIDFRDESAKVNAQNNPPAVDPLASLETLLYPYRNPNADLEEYLKAPPTPEEQGLDPKAAMRNNLISIMGTMSNLVAGGQRTVPGATLTRRSPVNLGDGLKLEGEVEG